LSLTLLLDLDDTLLTNPMDQFVAAYLRLLADHVSPYIQPDTFLDALLAATRLMSQNTDPDCLLKDVFDNRFYPAIGKTPEELSELFVSFYLHKFPQLQSLTAPRPEAILLVQEAFRRNYQVVIATNPLFPLTAIKQRLEWAGLSPAVYPFALVPSYETMHFAKPNPAFLAELLARLGWPEEPAIMIGNDPDIDISCSRCLGLPSFLVTDQPNGSSDLDPRQASGTLEQVLTWIDSTSAEQLTPDFTSPETMMAVLRSTPAAISSLSQPLSAEAWSQRVVSGEWCPTEIICHLWDVDAEVNLLRLQKVISEKNPFIPGQDTDPWAEDRGYIHRDGWQAFQRFSASRKKLINLLAGLADEDWGRPARHAIFGPTTLHELVSIICGHDRLHVRQLYTNIQAQQQR
jgi:FMN phosphatase YigB (HAD superfamily)